MNSPSADIVSPEVKTPTKPRRRSWLFRIPWFSLLFLFAAVNLSFLLGVFIILADYFPASDLRKAYAGAKAWYQRLWPNPNSTSKENFQTADPSTKRPDVVLDEPADTFDGFTLLTTTLGSSAQLLDMRGQVVHEWSLPFRKAWPKAPHITLPVPDNQIHWFRAYLYPNGDLLAIYHAEDDTPYGYGLAKLDKDSHLIWKYSAPAHHDVDTDENGTIYTLLQKVKDTPPKDLLPVSAESYISDSLVVLSPDGHEQREIALVDAMLASPYALFLRRNFEPVLQSKGDFLHANSVKVLKKDRAAKFPLFKAGQVLVSFRNQDLLTMVDPQTGKIVWAARGPWHEQHDAEFLDNGHLLIFDNAGVAWNRGSSPAEWQSRVLEFDPVTQAVSWCYPEGKGHDLLLSRMRGIKQRLPNGNTLIGDPDHGVVMEVTMAGKKVWEYLGPCYPDSSRIAILTGAHRYRESEVPFLQGIAKARP